MAKDITGKKFGRLVVLGLSEIVKRRKHKQTFWICRCKCGTLKIVNGSCLIRGQSKSCGCLRVEVGRTINLIHGKSNTNVFATWNHMLQRCRNKNNPAFARYGGRGIQVCKRWLKFENFYKDMGDQPNGLTLERKNNNRGYCPSNCAWETRLSQGNNKRNNFRIKAIGTTLTIAQWVRVLGIRRHEIAQRIRIGVHPTKVVESIVMRNILGINSVTLSPSCS